MPCVKVKEAPEKMVGKAKRGHQSGQDVKKASIHLGVARETDDEKSWVGWNIDLKRLSLLVLVLVLHTNNDTFERLEGEHCGHGSRDSSDKVGAHAAVEGPPAFFV